MFFRVKNVQQENKRRKFIGLWKVKPDQNVSWQSVVEMMKSLPQESDHLYLSFVPAENWNGTEDMEAKC